MFTSHSYLHKVTYCSPLDPKHGYPLNGPRQIYRQLKAMTYHDVEGIHLGSHLVKDGILTRKVHSSMQGRWTKTLAMLAASLGTTMSSVDKELPYIVLYMEDSRKKIRCYPYKRKSILENVAEESIFHICKECHKELVYPRQLFQLFHDSYLENHEGMIEVLQMR